MKNFKQLIIAILFSVGTITTVSAGGNAYSQRVENPSALQMSVQDLIHVPINGQSMAGSVDVLFRIDEFGRISVLSVNGTDEYMTDQVKTDLDHQRLNVAQEMTGKVFRMKFQYAS